MKNCGIYALVFHTENGEKFYIGSTTQPFRARLKYHCCELRLGRHRNNHLQHLWDKYGDFEFRILEICMGLSESEIRLREQYWIDKADPIMLINIGPALPSAAFGMKHSVETRAKIGEASKEHWQNSDYRARRAASYSVATRGKPFSSEHRAALSEAHKGVPLSSTHRAALAAAVRAPEVREKISRCLTGRKNRPHSQETRQKISEALKGRKLSPESCEKISKSKKGKKLSPEQCLNISKGHIGIRFSPERCKNISKSLVGKKRSLETREKMSKAHKGVPLSLEHRASLSTVQRKPASREKKSEIMKNYWSAKKAEKKGMNYEQLG